jgi:Ca2+-transporting ATPase
MSFTGLDPGEVLVARAEYGRNELPSPRPRSIAERALQQLLDPMILLLIGACCLTLLLGDYPDAAIIGFVVVANTAIGLIQERRAERALTALHTLSAPACRAIRSGVVQRLPSTELVPRDVILLEPGDVVPADAALLEAHGLTLNEAAMTGESFPVERRTGDVIRSGTVVTHGRGTAEVTQIGTASGLGEIAEAVASARVRATPLQRRLTRLSRDLVMATSAVCLVVFVMGVLRGEPLDEMVLIAVSLGVAAVPESLPAVVTIALALGAYRMAQRSAIVRTLPAVETLGSVTVLAVDKTGTITEGRPHVDEVWVPDGAAPGEAALLDAMVLCNDAAPVVSMTGNSVDVEGDPLDVALIEHAIRAGIDVDAVRRRWPRRGETPFDEDRRCMTTRHQSAGILVDVVKGAPEAVLANMPDISGGEDVRSVAARFAQAGRRVVAVARAVKGGESDKARGAHELLGLVALTDPPRAVAKDVVETCRAAGVRVILITGDHAETARAIAGEVSIGGGNLTVATADQLGADGRLVELDVIARTTPEQKVDIVRRLQDAGQVVAMTGDGVNDAPALQSADIGIAMGLGGTEVARQAAALVLADDDLRTVVVAIEEGRRILANIRTFLRYALSGGLAEVMVMVVAPFLGMPAPLLPGQILWINMLTHGLPGVAFGAEPADPSQMRKPSASPDKSVLGDRLWARIGVTGSAIAAVTLVAGTAAPDAESYQQTAMFVVLGLAQLFLALGLRARAPRTGWAGHSLEIATAVSVVALVAGVIVPSLRDLLHTTVPPGSWLPWVCLAAIPGVLTAIVRRPRSR